MFFNLGSELCLIGGAVIIGANIVKNNYSSWIGLLLILGAVTLKIALERDFN